MFWSTMAVQEERELDKKLKSAEDIDLRSILGDIHCLQEIRNQHEALLNFLKRDDIFKEMLTAVLRPRAVESDGSLSLKDKYKFAHQCCEAICIGAREFFPQFEKDPGLVDMLTNFLSDNAVNPLVVSFYSRVVISFLSAEPDKFVSILESSKFLDHCFSALNNCSLFELICTIANCLPDPAFRERIKSWYMSNGFARQLIDHLHPDQPSSVHENTAALWVEFIKALRDFQYNVEQCADPLLDSIQSEEIVLDLLQLMFPGGTDDGGTVNATDPSIVSNGLMILNALLETNQVRNSPSWILSQEMQGIVKDLADPIHQQQSSFNSTDGSPSSLTGQQLMMDPKRLVESHCAERSSAMIGLIIDSLEKSPDEFLGDQLCGCMQLLTNLTNTNFLPTHFELLRAFSAPSDPLRQIFCSVQTNPTRSIFNAQLLTLVMHILYSSTGTQKPLIDFIIKDFNILTIIREALPADEHLNDDLDSDRLHMIAKRSFFLQLANRLLQAQQTCPNADYIERLIKDLPDHDAWVEFCTKSVQSFVDQNRSEKIISMSTTNRSSNTIEIDELPDDNLLPINALSVETQNLFCEFHDMKLDPMFPNLAVNNGANSFSPKRFGSSFITAVTTASDFFHEQLGRRSIDTNRREEEEEGGREEREEQRSPRDFAEEKANETTPITDESSNTDE